jgi:hypothetical protein
MFNFTKSLKKMKLENLNLKELNTKELREIEGGVISPHLPVFAAIGAVCVWLWDKGEALGKSLAKNH